MNKKRFYIFNNTIRGNFGEVDKPLTKTEIVNLLDEQQDTIDRLKEDVQVYENTFQFLCFCDNKQMEKKILEQQSIIEAKDGLLSVLSNENEQLNDENMWKSEQIMKRDNLINDLIKENYMLQCEMFEDFEDYLESDFKKRKEAFEVE